MLLLPDAVTKSGIFGWSGMSSRNLSSSNLNFSVLTLSTSLRYYGNELYNRGLNTVNAFSWRDCAGFLFIECWIKHCLSCPGCFVVFILCPIVPSIFGTICCVIFQIYIIIERSLRLWRDYNLSSCSLSQEFKCCTSVILYVHVRWIDSIACMSLLSMDSRVGSSTLVVEWQEISRVSAWESAPETETLSTPTPSCLWPF